MNKRVLGVAMLGLGLIVGWWCFWSPPAASQPAGDGGKDGVKAGRYQYVSGGLFTVVMIDTQTGKTYALSSPNMNVFDGPRGDQPPEYAWVPIEKFEDLEAYRRWVRDRRESWMRDRFRFTTTTTRPPFFTTTSVFPGTTVPATTRPFFTTTTGRFATTSPRTNSR